VHTQVQSADSNCDHEYRRRDDEPQTRSPAFDPARADDIREHSVSHQRAKRVTAREAVRRAEEEFRGASRPRPLDEVLEDDSEQSRATEPRHPRGEHEPLSAREEQ